MESPAIMNAIRGIFDNRFDHFQYLRLTSGYFPAPDSEKFHKPISIKLASRLEDRRCGLHLCGMY